jgi:hypothetical protein
MLKPISLFLFVVMCTTATMQAQITTNPPPIKQTRTNLSQVFSKETEKIKQENSVLDVKKLEKGQRQVPKNKWTGTQKTLLILGIIGFAALLYVAIKYYHKCLRYEDNCNPADEGCYCAEYERRIKND